MRPPPHQPSLLTLWPWTEGVALPTWQKPWGRWSWERAGPGRAGPPTHPVYARAPSRPLQGHVSRPLEVGSGRRQRSASLSLGPALQRGHRCCGHEPAQGGGVERGPGGTRSLEPGSLGPGVSPHLTWSLGGDQRPDAGCSGQRRGGAGWTNAERRSLLQAVVPKPGTRLCMARERAVSGCGSWRGWAAEPATGGGTLDV